MLHVHMSPLGLGELFEAGEMFENDLEGDPVGRCLKMILSVTQLGIV